MKLRRGMILQEAAMEFCDIPDHKVAASNHRFLVIQI